MIIHKTLAEAFMAEEQGGAHCGCPFCKIGPDRIVAENGLAVALGDGFPVNPGHTLIVTRRHVTTWFGASRKEQRAIMDLVEQAKAALDGTEQPPDGYNIGINVGAAAGQTVPHLHVHLIPRFTGDVDDPAGGVRFVIPCRGDYRRPGRIPVASAAH